MGVATGNFAQGVEVGFEGAWATYKAEVNGAVECTGICWSARAVLPGQRRPSDSQKPAQLRQFGEMAARTVDVAWSCSSASHADELCVAPVDEEPG